MRIVSAVFGALLLLFAIVQFNDPDALLWVVIYGTPALWCGLAAIRPSAFALAAVRLLLAASVAVAIFGTVWYFPRTEGFWQMKVWWETESAREGMGMMIVLIGLAVAWIAARVQNRTS